MKKQFYRNGNVLVALDHTSFIGWRVLEAVEQEHSKLWKVKIQRPADRAHWVHPSKRPTYWVWSKLEYIPESVFRFIPTVFRVTRHD